MQLNSLSGANAAKARRGVQARDSELFRFGRVFLCLAVEEPSPQQLALQAILFAFCVCLGRCWGAVRLTMEQCCLRSFWKHCLEDFAPPSPNQWLFLKSQGSRAYRIRGGLELRSEARDKQTGHAHQSGSITSQPAASPHSRRRTYVHLARMTEDGMMPNPAGAVDLSSSLAFLHSAYCVTTCLVLEPGRLAKDTGGPQQNTGTRHARLPLSSKPRHTKIIPAAAVHPPQHHTPVALPACPCSFSLFPTPPRHP
jgi:hypothetical protein